MKQESIGAACEETQQENECESTRSFLMLIRESVDFFLTMREKKTHLDVCPECFEFLTEIRFERLKRERGETLARIVKAPMDIYAYLVETRDERPLDNPPLSILRDNEAEAILHTICNASPIGIALLELKTGRFKAVSPRYCELMGYSPSDLHNMTYHDITCLEDIAKSEKAHEFLKKGQVGAYEVEKTYKRPDGRKIRARLIVQRVPILIGGDPCFISAVIPINFEAGSQKDQVPSFNPIFFLEEAFQNRQVGEKEYVPLLNDKKQQVVKIKVSRTAQGEKMDILGSKST